MVIPSMRLFLFVIIATAVAGCESHHVPSYTLLYTRDHQVNIWSYQPVEGEGYVSRPIRPNERVVLQGGAIVSFDGEHVLVNHSAVSSRNAVVERDGSIHQGAFVRTFD